MRTHVVFIAALLTSAAFAQPGTTATPPKPATPAQPTTTPTPTPTPTPAPTPATPPAPPAPAAAQPTEVPNLPVVSKSEVEGMIIEEMKIGTGYEVKPLGAVVANYHGTLKDGGKIFDSTYDATIPHPHPEPAAFPLANVIPGWQKGVPGMKIGGIRRLTIPAALAYGERGNQSVPPNADLVFIIELVDAVQIEDIKVGDGEEASGPVIAETNYTIVDKDGKEIEKSDPKRPFLWVPNEFQGLQFGLEGMKVGGKRKIYIPRQFNHSNTQLAPDRPQDIPCTVNVELTNCRNLRPKAPATSPPAPTTPTTPPTGK
jgi:FKBP-type peptidyl-prolyl cis-trans isomerase